MKRLYSLLSLLFICSALVFAQAPQTPTKPDSQSQMGASCPMGKGQCTAACCKEACSKECCGKACATKDGKMVCTKDCCTTKSCKMKGGKSCCGGSCTKAS